MSDVGKIRLANEPLVNHWWNTTLNVTATGLTTSTEHARGANSGASWPMTMSRRRRVANAADAYVVDLRK